MFDQCRSVWKLLKVLSAQIHTNSVSFDENFLKCITASYITDIEIMHVEGGGVTCGFTTNMCQHKHQKAMNRGLHIENEW